MTAFTPIAFLDTFDLVASLPARMGLFRDAADGSRMLALRTERPAPLGEDAGIGRVANPFGWYAAYTKWPEMKNLLGRLKRIGDVQLGEIELGHVYLEMLDADTVTQWRRPEASPWVCAHLPVRTNPAAFLYAGREMTHLLPGQLTVVDRGVWSSAVNWGEYARIHLVIEFRKKETAT
jgi:hypothetical protein